MVVQCPSPNKRIAVCIGFYLSLIHIFGPRGEDSWGYGFYYSYLTAVPENYKLYIDDYEITVDWEEIFEDRGFRG